MAEYERRLCVRGYHVYQKLPRAGMHIAPYFKAHRGTVCLIWSALLILGGLGSCTSRFASAITDDGISEESGPFESGNPLI